MTQAGMVIASPSGDRQMKVVHDGTWWVVKDGTEQVSGGFKRRIEAEREARRLLCT